MFTSTELVHMSQELARHAGARQAEIARNVANADTPGYRARDLVPFQDVYRQETGVAQRATRPGHIATQAGTPSAHQTIDAHTEPSPNGNSVSLETEIMKSAEVRQAHGMALAVYKASMDLMRTAIGRGR